MDKNYVSVPKNMDPMSITLDEVLTLFKAKQDAAKEKVIRTFEDEVDMQILRGRYGPYIAYEKKNYKIPSDKEPASLTVDDCRKIIETYREKASKPRGSQSASRKK